MDDRPICGKKSALLPLPEQLQHIAFAGFSGIYVDRAGFKDYGKVIEARLRENLGVAPLTSANGRLLFYDMHPYIKKLRTIYGPDEWQVISKQILQPVLVQWGKGFYELEQNQQMRWRWASNRAELTLQNLGRDRKQLRLNAYSLRGPLP
jgi:phosphoglycerol transferase